MNAISALLLLFDEGSFNEGHARGTGVCTDGISAFAGGMFCNMFSRLPFFDVAALRTSACQSQRIPEGSSFCILLALTICWSR